MISTAQKWIPIIDEKNGSRNTATENFLDTVVLGFDYTYGIEQFTLWKNATVFTCAQRTNAL